MISSIFKPYCGPQSDIRLLKEYAGLLNDAITYTIRVSGRYLVALAFLEESNVNVRLDEGIIMEYMADILAGLDALRIDIESEIESAEHRLSLDQE